ncbi:hypothetical protein [Solimicrobium silvestre]|uniref:Uncharacterized protein n=1 Tax=Solimicrobium silvestre TaxID=2099400 RepID=A0A2S9H2X1_9BURK|nr:hypothetical protein [Solimicrobium silvestre]PRC94324.1 hypothetical protein S2091_0945 [Solimicrobium silvestre]
MNATAKVIGLDIAELLSDFPSEPTLSTVPQRGAPIAQLIDVTSGCITASS